MVLPRDPDRELRKVLRVHELTERSPAAPDCEGRTVTLGEEALVDEARDHVTVLDGKVVPGTIDIGGDYRSEVASVLQEGPMGGGWGGVREREGFL